MTRTFFTADCHLGHRNIIKYCKRPFDSVKEMDNTIIDNWNSKVTNEDKVYHLGDFTFKNRFGFENYVKRLNGEIIFLRGDHDHKKIFKDVPHLLNLKIDGQSLTLCHWCMRVWRKSHFNAWHLYGHSHGMLPPIGKSWDVGVDNNGFHPVSFTEIWNLMQTRPNNPNMVKFDEKRQ